MDNLPRFPEHKKRLPRKSGQPVLYKFEINRTAVAIIMLFGQANVFIHNFGSGCREL